MASICSLCGRLITQVIIARMLGPKGLGQIAYMVWLIEIANLLVCFGLPSSLTRYLAELHGQGKTADANRLAQWVFVRYVLLAAIGAVAVGVFFVLSSQYAGMESALPALMVLFLARGLETINHADLAGRQRFDLLARINVIAAAALAVGVAAGTFWFGVTGALYGYLAGAIVPAVCSFTILRGYSFRRQVAGDLRGRVWKFTFHTWLAMLVSAFVWSRMELFFLERYWDMHEVAMFTVGLTFAMMIGQMATLLSGASMAHFSHLVGSGNHGLLQGQYETATRLLAFIIVPMAFGGAAIMPVLLPLLYGPAFASAVPNAMVLTATSALGFSTIGSGVVYAKERSGFIAVGGLAGAVLSITAGVLIVPGFGAVGAAWSRLFVQGVMVVLGTWFIVCRLHLSCPLKSLARTTVAGGACGLAAWGVIHIIPHPIGAISAAVPIGMVAYAVVVKWLRVLGPAQIQQLKRATNRLPLKTHRPFGLAIDAMASVR